MKMKRSAVMIGALLGTALMAAPLWAAGPGGAGQGMEQARDALILAQGQGGGMGGGMGGAGAGRGQAQDDPARVEERVREQVRENEADKEQAERAREQIRQETQERQNGTGPQDNRGMEQQRERVMEQEQRELGRGSEQGQAAREEHRRKWWRFWDRSGE